VGQDRYRTGFGGLISVVCSEFTEIESTMGMKMKSDTAIFAEQILAAASTARTVVVDGFPQDGTAFARVMLDTDEMLRLVSVVKPRLLYLHQQWFDCAEEIADYSEGLEAGGDDEIDISPLSRLKKSNKIYDGELCLVYVGFAIDSVLHLTLEEAEWYSDFQSEVIEQVDRLKLVQFENRKNSNLKAALEIEAKAAVLANDPAFNFNRPSREKRTYLAEKIFPECKATEIYQIVDKATNINWLSQQRTPDLET
jgi:hypothetical protein